MSDESAGIPPEDTPQPDAPAGVSDTPDEGTAIDQQTEQQNWEARYKEAQAWGTRVAQEKAQLEQQAQLVNDLQSEDYETRNRALQALGLELEPEPEPQYDDPSDALAARLERLEQQLSVREQQAAQEQQIAQIEAHVEAQLNTLDGLDDSVKQWIVDRAVAMPPTAERMPDIAGAYAQWQELENALKQNWANTKRAPRISQAGQAGTQALPLEADHNARVQEALQRLQENS